MEIHHYRVVVRGVFDGLDDAARERLTASAANHDIFDSAFTADGTLTYDHHLHAFNTRFALRATVTDGDVAPGIAEVESTAIDRTWSLLGELGVGGRDLRITTTDMADMWGSAGRRDRLREARSRDA